MNRISQTPQTSYVSYGPFDPIFQVVFVGAPISIPPTILTRMVGMSLPKAGERNTSKFPYLTTAALYRRMVSDTCAIHVHKYLTMYRSRTPDQVLSYIIRKGVNTIAATCMVDTDFTYEEIMYEIGNVIRLVNLAKMRTNSKLSTQKARVSSLFGQDIEI
jgi:hypothetical protein